jgi:hypothetical protein
LPLLAGALSVSNCLRRAGYAIIGSGIFVAMKVSVFALAASHSRARFRRSLRSAACCEGAILAGGGRKPDRKSITLDVLLQSLGFCSLLSDGKRSAWNASSCAFGRPMAIECEKPSTETALERAVHGAGCELLRSQQQICACDSAPSGVHCGDDPGNVGSACTERGRSLPGHKMAAGAAGCRGAGAW